MSFYVGDSNGIAREVSKVYTGRNGSAVEVTKMYIGDENGDARLFYEASSPPPPTGSSFEINGVTMYYSDGTESIADWCNSVQNTSDPMFNFWHISFYDRTYHSTSHIYCIGCRPRVSQWGGTSQRHVIEYPVTNDNVGRFSNIGRCTESDLRDYNYFWISDWNNGSITSQLTDSVTYGAGRDLQYPNISVYQF